MRSRSARFSSAASHSKRCGQIPDRHSPRRILFCNSEKRSSLPLRNQQPQTRLSLQPGKHTMSRNSAFILVLLLGALIAPGRGYAQLTPPAGSAGAGNSPISGVPFGPANPRGLSDPSGLGNASSVPPLRTNTPVSPPRVDFGPVSSSPSRVTVPYVGASQRLSSPLRADAKKPAGRHRARPEVSKFSGICRGC